MVGFARKNKFIPFLKTKKNYEEFLLIIVFYIVVLYS